MSRSKRFVIGEIVNHSLPVLSRGVKKISNAAQIGASPRLCRRVVYSHWGEFEQDSFRVRRLNEDMFQCWLADEPRLFSGVDSLRPKETEILLQVRNLRFKFFIQTSEVYEVAAEET